MSTPEILTVPRRKNSWELLLEENAGKSGKFKMGSRQDWIGQVQDRLKEPGLPTDYTGIHQLLLEENQGELTHKQAEYLKVVRDGRAVFVVTGQQPGLLGGPIFWLYKALTALHYCNQWNNTQELGGIVLVPLFWIAGDDSDFRECSHLHTMGITDKEIVKLPEPVGRPGMPVSLLDYGAEFDSLVGAKSGIWDGLGVNWIRKKVSSSNSFTENFKSIFNEILGSQGFLLVNGFSSTLRKMYSRSMVKLLTDKDVDLSIRRETSWIQGRGLVPVVKRQERSCYGFILDDNNRRHRIFKEPTGFSSEASEGIVTESEIEALAREGRITHDVLSRPLLAGSVFPIIGHVLGPSEIGYFHQLAGAFQELHGSRPIVIPRMSATLLDRDQFDLFKKLRIEPENLPWLQPSAFKQAQMEFLSGVEGTEVSSEGSRDMVEAREAVIRHISGHLKSLENQEAERVRRTVTGKLELLTKEIQETFREEKYRQGSLELKPFRKAYGWLGKGSGQERKLSLPFVLDQFSQDGLNSILAALDGQELAHQLIIV